jgi:hypothetical protein
VSVESVRSKGEFKSCFGLLVQVLGVVIWCVTLALPSKEAKAEFCSIIKKI